jgi:hypothetical protein
MYRSCPGGLLSDYLLYPARPLPTFTAILGPSGPSVCPKAKRLGFDIEAQKYIALYCISIRATERL